MSIKIDADFHGKKKAVDMWINYWPNDCCNMDSRVIDFFNELYEAGMKVYNTEVERYWEEQHKSEIEEREKAELIRLQKKYKQDIKNTK